MKIADLKINGMINPLGYDFDRIGITFNLADTDMKKLFCKMEISDREDFSHLVYSSKADPLHENVVDFAWEPATRYHIKITVLHDDEVICKDESGWFETAGIEFKGKWISTDCKSHPVFSTEFDICKKVASARMYVCGLGMYEAYINGKKISDEYLNPLLNDYEEEYEYQTFNITEDISVRNELCVLLGDGWYKGRFGLNGKCNNYGDSYLLRCDVVIRYEDGTRQIIGTDENWKVKGSSIVSDSVYDGEVIDETINDDTVYKCYEVKVEKPLVARTGLPVKEYQRLKPVEVIITPKNETVLDFGQNIAGIISFNSHLGKGETVTFDFGETLQNGCFYNDNYRSAKAQFVYTSDGKEKEVRPHFTYFGFRYLRISGNGKVKAEEVTAIQLSTQLERTGYFHCSDEKLNRLYENALYSQLDNYVDIPTDCPQRDEKLGWTGDAQCFAPTACYNFDTRMFFARFLRNLNMYQKRNGGAVPNYFPMQSFLGGSSQIWGDAITFIPDLLRRYYGNEHLYEKEYEMMNSWLEYVIREMADDKLLVKGHMQFGDWLALDGVTEQSMRGGTDEDYVASMYLYESLKKTAVMGRNLNRDVTELEKKAEFLRNNILNEFFSNTGKLCVDTQTGYLLALWFEVYRDKDEIIRGFKRRLERDAYRIRCGFVGAPNMLQIMAENGMERDSLRLLLNEEYPGWLYEVNHGATTIWERWNSLLDDGSISGTGMNSLNHYAYGNVVEFLYGYLAGIKPLEDGFTRVRIRPLINGFVDEVDCEYNSVNGRYQISWKINAEGNVNVHVEVPYGCKALIQLPGLADFEVEAGSHDWTVKFNDDIRKVYDDDSFLKELAANEKIAEYLKANNPQLYYMGLGDEESKHLTINKIRNMPYLDIPSQFLNELSGFIRTVKY
ncbi:MAG: family 78 glycoside hydrolase catalytic domain [Erysipelotrichaceae bacterium]|nr:family 78 glycoside hydrolase catalytic domain [Erysipelotrichaceae bacterium]